MSLLIVSGAYADVALTPENFPDEAFRSYVKGFDVDSDDTSELISVDRIYLVNTRITDLSGIEHFTNLRYLECGYNISSLDLSSNVELEYLNCSGNKFTELDLSGCKNLMSLDCFSKSLQVNVSHIAVSKI